MSEKNVRDANESDLQVVMQLLNDNLSAYLPEETKHKLFPEGNNLVRKVAQINDEVVGYASLLIEQNARGGKLGHIEDVVVAKQYHGQGLGELLIKSLESAAKERDVYKVGLASTPIAEGFYDRLGFDNAARYYVKKL